MIFLTKLNGVPFVLNCDQIETIEENPDTTIHLSSKSFVIVKEPMTEIIEKVIDFKRATNDIIRRISSEDKES